MWVFVYLSEVLMSQKTNLKGKKSKNIAINCFFIYFSFQESATVILLRKVFQELRHLVSLNLVVTSNNEENTPGLSDLELFCIWDSCKKSVPCTKEILMDFSEGLNLSATIEVLLGINRFCRESFCEEQ